MPNRITIVQHAAGCQAPFGSKPCTCNWENEAKRLATRVADLEAEVKRFRRVTLHLETVHLDKLDHDGREAVRQCIFAGKGWGEEQEEER